VGGVTLPESGPSEISYIALGQLPYLNRPAIGRINPSLKFRLRTSRQTRMFAREGSQELAA